jgi:hypothetical protein
LALGIYCLAILSLLVNRDHSLNQALLVNFRTKVTIKFKFKPIDWPGLIFADLSDLHRVIFFKDHRYLIFASTLIDNGGIAPNIVLVNLDQLPSFDLWLPP